MGARRLLVTGAAKGIGRAVMIRALADGDDVLAVDRDPIDLTGIDVPAGRRLVTARTDLADLADLDALVTRVADEFGKLDAIVHVAGVIIRRDSIDLVTEADFDLQYAVNMKGAFFLVVRLRHLVRDGGSIVLFSSQGWWTGGLGGSLPYAATKAGVVAMTRGLAKELAPRRIRVNAIAPGFVDTDMMREGLSADRRDELVADVPLGRMADPEEIAASALLLTRDDASYLTGITLNATGGQLTY